MEAAQANFCLLRNTSRLIVADFTGNRCGVYFAAEYAMEIDSPIFRKCRKDEISELHFDIRQFNCIECETSEELVQRLQSKVEPVIDKGPR